MAYRKRTEAEKRRLVAAWRRFGVPKTRFAQDRGLPASAFARWITRYDTPAGTSSRRATPVLADEAVARIGVLFDIERRIRDADRETRRRTRDTETLAVFDELHAWMLARVHGLRPTSPIAKAFRYALNQWDPLTTCVTHLEIPIHNDCRELQLRRPVIGPPNRVERTGSSQGSRAGPGRPRSCSR